MSVITNVTVPVGNWAVEPAVVGTGSEVGLEIGIADTNPAGRGGERLGRPEGSRQRPGIQRCRVHFVRNLIRYL